MSADFYADLLIVLLALSSFLVVAPHIEWQEGWFMAVKDYWVYQKRDTLRPWALYVVKEYDRRKPESTMIDWTLYHEDIPTQTHSKTFSGLRYPTVRAYVDAIAAEMAEYVPVEAQDYKQLEQALSDILR